MAPEKIDEHARLFVDQAIQTEKKMGFKAHPSKARYQRAVHHAVAAMRDLAEATADWTPDTEVEHANGTDVAPVAVRERVAV